MFSGPFSLILPRCEGGASLRHPAQAAARIAPYAAQEKKPRRTAHMFACRVKVQPDSCFSRPKKSNAKIE